MYNAIITLLSNLFRMFIIYRFIGIFFDVKSKNSNWIHIIQYILFYFVTSVVHILFHQPTLNLFTNLIGLFFLIHLYSSNIKKSIFLSCGIYAVFMLCDIIAVFIFTNYKIGDKINEIYAVVTLLLVLISEVMIEKIVHRNNEDEIVPKYWLVLLIVPMTSLVLLQILLIDNARERYLVISQSFGILIINITVFYLYNAIMKECIQQKERDYLTQQNEIYKNQLEVITNSQDRIRALQHDLKHHIAELYSRAERSNDVAVQEYLDKMYDFANNSKEYVYSGNKEIDGILNYMLQKAKRLLNDVQVELNIPEKFLLQTFELNVILGNLLDNAIEAASKSGEKYLSVKLESERGILLIHISNSYNGVLEKDGDHLKTTKKNKTKHGIGLENVKRMVELLNGSMKTWYDSTLFCTDIMLYIN